MVEGVGFEIRKVGHAGAGVQIVSSPPKKETFFVWQYKRGFFYILDKNLNVEIIAIIW